MSSYIELKTERLLLRPIDKKDSESLFAYRSDYDMNSFIAKISTEVNIPNTWSQFVIVDTKSSSIIGDVGVHFVDADQVELGVTLAKESHGHGYATEALKLVIDWLFTSLNKHRITTSIDPRNFKSIALVERVGFIKEAHFRESLFLDGEWVDDIIYAILRKEWV